MLLLLLLLPVLVVLVVAVVAEHDPMRVFHCASPSPSQEMTNAERSHLLQFVTGTARVPVGGLAALQGHDGEWLRRRGRGVVWLISLVGARRTEKAAIR